MDEYSKCLVDVSSGRSGGFLGFSERYCMLYLVSPFL